MTGERWVFREMVPFGNGMGPDGRLIAEVSTAAMTTRQADAFELALSKRLGRGVGSYRLGEGVKENPTLVHHGQAKQASHHIVTADSTRGAIADLYFVGDDTARKIAGKIAKVLRLNLYVLGNEGKPFTLSDHPTVGAAQGHPRVRVNPAGEPRVGEIWTTLSGGRCKVLDVRGGRVLVLHMEVGDREWIELREFLASYRLRGPRTMRNPGPRVVYNKLLGGWYVVVGPHQTPLNGRFNSKAEAQAWLGTRRNPSRLRAAVSGRAPSRERGLSVPDRHRLKIARDTLKMNDAMARVMGGMTKDEARAVIYELTGVIVAKDNPSRSKRARSVRKALRSGLNRKTRRAVAMAVRQVQQRGPMRGTAAKSIHYVDSAKARRVSRANPASTYILEVVGDKFQAARAAADRGIPAAFIREVKFGRKLITRLRIGAQFAGLAAAWYQQKGHGKVGGLRAWYSSNPRRKSQQAMFERFTIELPNAAVFELSGQGDVSESASYWADRIKRPASVTPEALRAELKEYGAWDASELGDDAANWQRILWIAAGNLKEGTRRNPIPRSIDKRSVRTTRTGMRVGCPRGHWHDKSKSRRKCDVGMRRVNPRGSMDAKTRDMILGWLPPKPTAADVERVAKYMRDTLRIGGIAACRALVKEAIGITGNPSSEMERARATFKKWHEFDSTHPPKKMKGPGRTIPKTLVKLGDLVSVVYRSNKYTGKQELYEHKTKSPHPVLATDPDGRHVHIVGGKMKVTADGLVN